MHRQRLAPRPGVPHDGSLVDVHHLLDHVQLAQAVVLMLLASQFVELRLVLPAYILQRGAASCRSAPAFVTQRRVPHRTRGARRR